MFYLQIPNILFLHEGFLEELKRRLENWDSKKTIGDWFLDSVSVALVSLLSCRFDLKRFLTAVHQEERGGRLHRVHPQREESG